MGSHLARHRCSHTSPDRRVAPDYFLTSPHGDYSSWLGNSQEVEGLVDRYYTRIGHLQGSCFYNGMCDPAEETQRRIRETIDYIRDAERLASL